MPRRLIKILGVLSASGFLALQATAGQLNVKLTVKEPAGVARKADTARGGVPLPKGAFKKGQEFTVTSGGRAIPAQVVPMVVDEKGFLRWVLVDTQLDLPAKGKVELLLTAGKSSAKPATAIKVTDGAGGVTVETGKIKLTIAKDKPFSLFSTVAAGGKPVVAGGEVSYTDATSGTAYKAAKPTSIETSYIGPMRVTLKVSGFFVGDDKTKMRYIARVSAWAGHSDVHVKYSLVNSNPKQYAWRFISDSRISMKLGAKPEGTSAVDEQLGWISTKVGGAGVFACDRFYRDNPVRKLAVSGDSLVLSGVAAKRQMLDNSHLSSEYVLDFAAAGGANAMPDKAQAARHRLHVLAEPSWYSDTEGLEAGKFGTQADEMKCYDLWGWKYDKGRAPKRPGRSRGRYTGGCHNHYDSEGDVLEQQVLMYIRTGGARAYWDSSTAWGNHGMDLRIHRTDGHPYRDGGVWWSSGGPSGGNRPTRAKDPVSGKRNYYGGKLVDRRQCYCHNYAAGMAAWFCLTGDQDAKEAAIDSVEMNYDFSHRAYKKLVGKTNYFSRDFTRFVRGASAVRLIAPTDELVVKMSDYAAQSFLQRPVPEPRGFVNHPGDPNKPPRRKQGAAKAMAKIRKHAGTKGMEAFDKTGVKLDPAAEALVDKQGRKWRPIFAPWSFMFPMIYRGIDSYGMITGDEDANDWSIALAKAFSQVAFQPHCNFHHYSLGMVDFPVRGICRDAPTWTTMGTDNKFAKGIGISGYTARHWPDGPVRGYSRCGEKVLLERGKDLWFGGSHRGYGAKKMHRVGGVGMWVNSYRTQEDNVGWTLRLFYEYSHMRKDQAAPGAVKDLAVTINGDKATVTFTAPGDQGGGKVARYQVKCSDKPIVDYEQFLKKFADFKDGECTNWWMAKNVKGEPAPKAAGAKESFTVTGVPAGAKFFAVRAYDDSSNRNKISNVSGK